nr:MAG TPA: hypothetical protein [Caudoviricetes sp.]
MSNIQCLHMKLKKSLKQTNQPLIPKLSPVLRYERASIGLIARMILRNKP